MSQFIPGKSQPGLVYAREGQIEELQAEIERLKAALRVIIEVEPSYEFDWGIQLQDIARAALKGKP